MTACESKEKEPATTPAPNKVVENKDKTDNQDNTDNKDNTDSNEGNKDNDSTQAISSLAEFYEDFKSKVELEPLFEAPDDFVLNYFGIDKASLDDSIFYIAESEISTETLIIVKTNVNNKEEVENSLNTYIENKKNELRDYLPQQYEIADKAGVCTKGDYMYLVMSENADSAKEYIEQNL